MFSAFLYFKSVLTTKRDLCLPKQRELSVRLSFTPHIARVNKKLTLDVKLQRTYEEPSSY